MRERERENRGRKWRDVFECVQVHSLYLMCTDSGFAVYLTVVFLGVWLVTPGFGCTPAIGHPPLSSVGRGHLCMHISQLLCAQVTPLYSWLSVECTIIVICLCNGIHAPDSTSEQIPEGCCTGLLGPLVCVSLCSSCTLVICEF